jgi:hypothetical protein
MLTSSLFRDVVRQKLVVGNRYSGTNILSLNICNLPTYSAQPPQRSKTSTVATAEASDLAPYIPFLVRNGKYLIELKKKPPLLQ